MELNDSVMTDEEYLAHYGMPKRSGRYPWGSGENPYQRTSDFVARIELLKKKGYAEKEMADDFGLTISQFRTQRSLATNERKSVESEAMRAMRDDGKSLAEIAKAFGYANDSSVRSKLNENAQARRNVAYDVAMDIKKVIDEKGVIDVGAGVERELGISKEKLKEALYILELEGYPTFGGRINQATNPGKKTTVKVVGPPGTPKSAPYDTENIHSLTEYKVREDANGQDRLTKGFRYPESMDSKRLAIRYAEDGGTDKDGVVEIRRNVPDLSLGESKYAQVRILVDGDRYIKGMAMYSDNIPEGKDLMFNTNKKRGTDVRDVLKKISKDPDNPFGSLIKENGGQSEYTDPKTGKQKLSLINKRAEEGDWQEWADKLPSQFLAKQSKTLINKQLNLSIAEREAEFNEIKSLDNPVVKKVLLKKFADSCDAAAVHLKAAALPGQKYHVILPIDTLSDKEVYAPKYANGDKLALIRYPHGGTFEIPILTVNNKHKDSIKAIGPNSNDAIGINSRVAEILSGADFDGDTVQVIPTGKHLKISSKPPLDGLKGFDPKIQYATTDYDEATNTAKVGDRTVRILHKTDLEMGKVSNLITDMTLKGATDSELARAVRHSMVVIDAEKHKLDYKKSEQDNNILGLKKKYQGRIDPETGQMKYGAATLISRAKNEKQVPKRIGQAYIDPKTGKQLWEYTDPKTGEFKSKYDREPYEHTTIGKDGTKKVTTKYRYQKSTQMEETDDARTLSSGTDKEEAYARYANRMKAMANEARKDMLATPRMEVSPSAKITYAKEVASLKSKLNDALKNAPRERKAQMIADAEMKKKIAADDDLKNDKKMLKKLAQQSLTKARVQVGAKREPIVIEDREWEAIQARAITQTHLKQIVENADLDVLKEKATPRTRVGLTSAQVSRMKSLANRGYTIAEIANAMNVSTSTVSNNLK